MHQVYAVGFLHDDQGVVLVRKNRPEWQAGLLNGVGGHFEEYDHYPLNTMIREFHEEAGVRVEGWEHFLTLKGPYATIWCYALKDDWDLMSMIDSQTDEQVSLYTFEELETGQEQTVPNLKWIIPLMRQRENYKPIVVNFHGDS